MIRGTPSRPTGAGAARCASRWGGSGVAARVPTPGDHGTAVETDPGTIVTMTTSSRPDAGTRPGRVRMLADMVLTNRPWRLVLGMRSALAAIIATSAYLVITSTVWQLASALSWTKLVITLVVAVTMMVVWIVGAHHLWNRSDQLRE